MLDTLEISSMETFQRIYSEGLNKQLSSREFAREAFWTESLAVGDRTFIEGVTANFSSRRRFNYEDDVVRGNPTCFVREK